MDTPLRLLIYDRTCRGRRLLPGLSSCWQAGAWLYGGLGRLDAARGVASWPEALDWLCRVGRPRPVAEVQYWGHGRWGEALIVDQPMDRDALTAGHPLHEKLIAVRDRMMPGGAALWWFRTCETFGAEIGQDFARCWTEFLGCRGAGHTHVIGFYQSGLHSIGPGDAPGWSATEGLAEGSAERPALALPSRRGAPNTITCLNGTIPEGY